MHPQYMCCETCLVQRYVEVDVCSLIWCNAQYMCILLYVKLFGVTVFQIYCQLEYWG